MGSTNSLRVGVIGLGMGHEHIVGYRQHPGTKVVAVADLDPDRLKMVAEEFQVPGRYSLRKVPGGSPAGGDDSVGLHFETCPPGFSFGSDRSRAMEFWITVVKL